MVSTAGGDMLYLFHKLDHFTKAVVTFLSTVAFSALSASQIDIKFNL